MDLFAIAGQAAAARTLLAAEAEGGGLAINLFWIVVASANFIVFALILYFAFGRQISGMLESRRQRIEQGLKDAEQARHDRESAEQERLAALAEARRESNEILARAQKVAQETRDADIAATRAERGAAGRLPTISAEYRRLVNRQRGVVEALVTSAAPLSAGETDALRAKVAQMTDKTVDLVVRVDDALIGGLTVRIGDTLYDASVRGRLERLREQLVSGAR